MRIISHRGYCIDYEKENNKRIAFERSFDLGFGTETDLRDDNGKIVISHNMPKGDEMTFEEFLQLLNGRNLPLALNIKADGQGEEIERLLKKYGHTDYFTFDMSIPDLVYQLSNTELIVYSGYSDVNQYIPMKNESKGVWLDSFYEPWYQPERISDLLLEGKGVCVVSEDLHGRDNKAQWELLKKSEFINNDSLMLCTNCLEEAIHFFEV